MPSENGRGVGIAILYMRGPTDEQARHELLLADLLEAKWVGDSIEGLNGLEFPEGEE